MDISGYRGGHYHRSRSSGLMPSTYDPKRKPRSRTSVSLASRAVLLLLFVVAAGAGIRRAMHRGDPAGQDSGASGGKGASSKRGAAALPPPPTQAANAAADARREALMTSRIQRAMRIVPVYRGAGKLETFPHFSNANRLLLASHGRLLWYRYDADEVQVLHEGEGVYYGAFPGIERGVLGEPSTLWVVSRPHNWRPSSSQEWLLHLDMDSGKELGRVQIASKWAHDAVRRRDRVYVCSTGEGKVLELAFPNMTMIRELPLFTLREHINTLGPTVDGKLWGVLHNLGASSLVQLDLASGKEALRIPNVGDKAHGLVLWGASILTLDSDGGALAQVDPASGAVRKLWQMSDGGKYLKGLCVVDDIAFFGIAARTERGRRDDPTLNCELAAFDLRTQLLLWRRQLPTKGLLNIVAAPHLVVESTTYSINTVDQIGYRSKKAYGEALDVVHKWQLHQEHEAQGMQKVAQHGGGRAADQGQEQEAQHGSGATGQAHEAQAAQQGQQGAGARDAAAGSGQQQQQQQQGTGVEAGAGEVRQHVQQGVQQDGQHEEAGQQQQQQTHGAAADDQDQQHHQQEHVQQQGQDQQHEGRQQQHAGVARRGLIEVEPVAADDPLAKFPPRLDPVRWSSGLPRLLLSAKDKEHGLAAGAQLRLLRTDTSGLKAALRAMPDTDWNEETQRVSNAWIEGRSKVLIKFKPGARSIMLIFSDQSGTGVYRFPWYDRFKQWVEPWLVQVLGPGDLDKVMRLQLAFMPPHSDIKRHMDSGGYAAVGHRIHVVVQSNPDVVFHVCESQQAAQAAGRGSTDTPTCVPLHVEEGLVFELNNRLAHSVTNGGDQPRIHLILDVSDTPRQQRQLRVGEVCRYVKARVVCPELEGQEAHGGGDVLRR